MKFPEITPERFYKVGLWCFTIIGFAKVLDLLFRGGNTIFGVIGSIFDIIFTFIVALFFKYLLKTTSNDLLDVQPEDISKDIQELQEGAK